MKQRHAIFLTLAGFLLVAGCGDKAVEKPPQSDPYRFETEGTIPPLVASDVERDVDRVDTFEDLPLVDESVAVENVVVVPEVVDPPVGSRLEPGYRVQIFASGEERSAASVRDAATARLNVPAYVEFIDGIYKVRVGDCRARPQAEELRERCRSAGYTDAWIVRAQVAVKNSGQSAQTAQ